MWYVEKECQYYSWIPFTMLVEWTRWSEGVTSNNIWCLSTTHIILSCIPKKCTDLHDRYFTCTASSSEIPRQKYVKYINMKRDISLQHVTFIQKWQWNANFKWLTMSQNIKHFEKNILGERQYPHKPKHRHNNQKKNWKSSMDMER